MNALSAPSAPFVPAPAAGAVVPADLEDQARQLAQRLVAEPRVESVVVLGSAARGETANAWVDGRTQVFSDLEFLVATRGRLSAARRRGLARELDALAAGFGHASPLFHVDLLFRERRRLRSLPPLVFTHELAANGRTLAGRDVIGEVRRVTLADLDRGNTHEILLKRLWALAEGLPAAWVRGEALDPVTARTLGVVLHRQPLDVTTVLLPEAGTLLPTYEARVRHWVTRTDLPFSGALDRALGSDCGAFLEHCLAERAIAAPAADPAAAHRDAFRLLQGALAWLLGTQAEGAAAAIARRSRHVFRERPLTPGEALAQARQAIALGRELGPARGLGWARAPRKGLMASGLLHLHQALVEHHRGAPEDARARIALARLAVLPIDDRSVGEASNEGFAARWLAARALIGRAFWRSIRLGDPAAWQRMATALRPPPPGA